MAVLEITDVTDEGVDDSVRRGVQAAECLSASGLTGAVSMATEENNNPSKSVGPTAMAALVNTGVAALVGAIATMVVGYFTFMNQSRELDMRMVDVSLSILSGEKGDDAQNTDAYIQSRTFAIKALRKFSGVAIDDQSISDWANSGAIPIGVVPASNEFGFWGYESLSRTIGRLSQGNWSVVDTSEMGISIQLDGASGQPEVTATIAPDVLCSESALQRLSFYVGVIRAGSELSRWRPQHCPSNVEER